jgi:single-strand DNA-binding protein
MNRILLVGRLTRDCELRYTNNGVANGKFTIAVDRNYTNQNGEKETDFIFISVWRGLAENCAKYIPLRDLSWL